MVFFKTLLYVVLIASVGGCRIEKPSIEVDLKALLEDVQKKARIIKQFRADFMRVRTSGAFRVPMVVNGVLVYQKPGIFSIRYVGDVNLEILSDGETVTLIHDRGHQDTFVPAGDGNGSLVSDTVMSLIRNIGEGGLEKFSILGTEKLEDGMKIEMCPQREKPFHMVQRISLWISYFGELKRIKVFFDGGDQEDTVFESWSVLADNEPEVLELETRLSELSRNRPQ